MQPVFHHLVIQSALPCTTGNVHGTCRQEGISDITSLVPALDLCCDCVAGIEVKMITGDHLLIAKETMRMLSMGTDVSDQTEHASRFKEWILTLEEPASASADRPVGVMYHQRCWDRACLERGS
jgi:hypothetical protein